MANLALTYGDVYKRVSEFLRISSNPLGTDLTLVQDITKRAYREFLYPVHPESGLLHTWSFLRSRGTIRTKVGEYLYPLPSNFVTILSSPKLINGEGKMNPEYVDVTKWMGLRTTSVATGTPEYYCVDIGEYHPETGQLHDVKFWYTPDAVYDYTYYYVFEPEAPTLSTDYFVGGIAAAEVIQQMAVGIAESQEDENDGEQQNKASRMLAAYMLWDKAYAMNAFGPGWDDARQVTRPLDRAGEVTDVS